MGEINEAFAIALRLIVGLNRELLQIIGLSLRVSLIATLLAVILGTPLGLVLTIVRFPGRRLVLILANALLGLPSVVVGLLVYLVFSRSGPLGHLGLLFTPNAMIIAQLMLTLPIVVVLVHRLTEGPWKAYGDSLIVHGASRPIAGLAVLYMSRSGLVTAALTAFGRAIAEVGAIIVVGGNIRGHTRTMTTAIALETSKGDLALALALGLVLLALTLAVNAATFALAEPDDR